MSAERSHLLCEISHKLQEADEPVEQFYAGEQGGGDAQMRTLSIKIRQQLAILKTLVYQAYRQVNNHQNQCKKGDTT